MVVLILILSIVVLCVIGMLVMLNGELLFVNDSFDVGCVLLNVCC